MATQLRERRKQQVRDTILNAAVELFVEHGFDQTTMSQIAETAGIARQTLFNYFHTKDDLLGGWVATRRAAVRSGLEQSRGTSAVDRLQRGFASVAELYDTDAQVNRRMVHLWFRRGGPAQTDAYNTARLFVDVLNHGKVDGTITPDLDVELGAHILMDTYLGCLNRWSQHGGSLTEQLPAAIGLLLSGYQPKIPTSTPA